MECEEEYTTPRSKEKGAEHGVLVSPYLVSLLWGQSDQPLAGLPSAIGTAGAGRPRNRDSSSKP